MKAYTNKQTRLNSIRTLIERGEKVKAVKFLLKFSSFVRSILSNSVLKISTLEKEIQTSSRYLALEAMQFDETFSYTINVCQSIFLLHILLLLCSSPHQICH